MFRFNFLEPGYRILHSEPLRAGRFSIRISVRARDFLFAVLVQTAVWPTHSPVQWVPGLSREYSGVPTHPYLAPRLRISGAVPLCPVCASCGMLCGEVMFIQRLLKRAPSRHSSALNEEPLLYRTAWRLHQVGLTPFHMLHLLSLSLGIRIVIGLLQTASLLHT